MNLTPEHIKLFATVANAAKALIGVVNTLREASINLNERTDKSVQIASVRLQEIEVYGHVPNGDQIAFKELYQMAMESQQHNLEDLTQQLQHNRDLIDIVDKLLEINGQLIAAAKVPGDDPNQH